MSPATPPPSGARDKLRGAPLPQAPPLDRNESVSPPSQESSCSHTGRAAHVNKSDAEMQAPFGPRERLVLRS